jgi:hypothetical protein
MALPGKMVARFAASYNRSFTILKGEIKMSEANEILCPAVSTFRLEGGKLAEGWEIFDSGDLLRQMQA